MKTALIILLGLYSSLSFAGGFHCRAQCVRIVPDEQSLMFFGTVHQEADASREDVFQWTQEKCEQRMTQYGYDRTDALLVKKLYFASSQSTQESTIYGRWYRYYEYDYSHQQSLEARPDFADEQSSCRYLKSIPTGTRPSYSGDTIFYP